MHHCHFSWSWCISFHILMMKPYSQAVLPPQRKYFNYQLSRARMVTEGLLVSSRVAGEYCTRNVKAQYNDIMKAKTLACLVLHNICIRKGDRHLRIWHLTCDQKTNQRRPNVLVSEMLHMTVSIFVTQIKGQKEFVMHQNTNSSMKKVEQNEHIIHVYFRRKNKTFENYKIKQLRYFNFKGVYICSCLLQYSILLCSCCWKKQKAAVMQLPFSCMQLTQ